MNSKRSIYGSILNIILSVIIFAIVLLIVINIYKSAAYGGRIECKIAYSLSAPFGMFANTGVIMEEAGKNILVGTAAALTIAITALTLKNYRSVAGIKDTSSLDSLIVSVTNTYTVNQIKYKSLKTALVNSIKTIFSNQKAVKSLAYAGIFGSSLYGIGMASNQVAVNLQEPILNALCKSENYLVITDFNIDTINSEIEKITYNSIKKEYFENLDNIDKSRFYVAYIIARKALDTYGESLGGSVKLGKMKTHYLIFINYTIDNKPIRISDIATVLDFMEIKQKNDFVSYYKLLFGESSVRDISYGEIYSSYCNYISTRTGSCNVTVSSDGSDKIIGSMLDLNTDNVYESLLIDKPGIYLINIMYDGLGSIYIKSYYYS
ncbi:MAG: hypothetical protein QW184_00860 [Nanopusillaceae archaeon]